MSLTKLIGETFKCDRCGDEWTDSWDASKSTWPTTVRPSAYHEGTVEYRSRGNIYEGQGHTRTWEVCHRCIRAFWNWCDAKKEQIDAEREGAQ